MKQLLITYIEEKLLNNEMEQPLEVDDDLLGDGILDSLGMMKLILFIESEFHIKIPPQDMVIENFMTVRHVSDYLARVTTDQNNG